MDISRRQVLVGMAAASAVAALPTIGEGPIIAPVAEAPAIAAVKERGWWGYSLNGGEWFNGPFESREEALTEARGDDPASEVITAWCIPEKMRSPDLRECLIEWMFEGGKLGVGIVSWWFDGPNQDIDYEGEVGDALAGADYKPLIADLRDACATALFRVGRPDLIAAIYDEDDLGPICEDDALLDRLGKDQQFERDCDDAGQRWLEAQDLNDVPRMLHTRDDEEHEPLEAESA